VPADWKVLAEGQRSFASAQDDSALWDQRGGKKRRSQKNTSFVQKLFCDRLFFPPPEYAQQRVILSASEGSPSYS